MYTRVISVLVSVFLLSVSAGWAQDPTKVESTHYKLAFENDRVQVVYIHYGPHERSSLHDHPGGVVVNLTNGHLRFTDQKGTVQEVRATHGEARWFPPVKHKVENLGDTAYDAVYIAVKSKGSSAAGAQPGPMDMDAETGQILQALLHTQR